MKHYGDITKLNGTELPVVDVITGGSPCQDLSIAGRRDGLAGERSGLFMEQVRIVREMRERDRDRGRSGRLVRPRYLVWENVPGAFSSNKGRDFQAVLTEIVRIAKKDAPGVPLPDGGRWPKAGAVMGIGDGGFPFSLSYRVHDAQFWGLPQRRKRIALVADFGGLSAPEILFERKSLSWDFDEGQPAGEEATAGAGGGAPGAVTLRIRGGCEGGGKGALIQTEKSGALNGRDVAGTLDASYYKGCGERQGVEREVVVTYQDVAGTLNPGAHPGSYNGQDAYNDMLVTHRTKTMVFDKEMYNCGKRMSGEPQARYDTVAPTVRADSHPSGVAVNQTVRRLTPLECERLQGYPDGWTDIGDWTDSKGKVRKTSDSARYKALGNSIALPYWKVLLKRISAQYDRDATLGSLFDGIGGFPYLWEQINGKGSALWASEIEEFPIAVTKRRLPE